MVGSLTTFGIEGYMRRREFITILGGAAAGWPLAAKAQQARSLLVIGFLSPGFSTYTGPGSSFDRLKDGLRDAGYVEGETVRIAARWGLGKPDTMPALAGECSAFDRGRKVSNQG